MSHLELVRLLRAVLAWQRRGGVVPGLQREYLEVTLRRLLLGTYNFRS